VGPDHHDRAFAVGDQRVAGGPQQSGALNPRPRLPTATMSAIPRTPTTPAPIGPAPPSGARQRPGTCSTIWPVASTAAPAPFPRCDSGSVNRPWSPTVVSTTSSFQARTACRSARQFAASSNANPTATSLAGEPGACPCSDCPAGSRALPEVTSAPTATSPSIPRRSQSRLRRRARGYRCRLVPIQRGRLGVRPASSPQ